MDPASATVGALVAAAVLVGLVVLGLGLAYGAGRSGEARAGAAELAAERDRRERAEALAGERLELLDEAEDLLDAQARGVADGAARLDALRQEVSAVPPGAPPAARVAAVRRMLLLGAARRAAGRAPVGPGPAQAAPAGDGRGADPVV